MTIPRPLLAATLSASLAALVLVPSSSAAIELARVQRERLANGLTVLVLEEHALPLVSVQMLYKVGARDEVTGRSGLAHFVEHMAFRATESFPDTGVVSRIYAVGGEWHGYTWTDQTTYYETVPREELSLVLAIEADRMARLLLPAEEVEAERGAVLAELNGYQNDPATVLKDAVLATSFLQHPYRNNTIGWPSEVERLTHADVEAFYKAHYRPANAVLAVVGDVEAGAVLAEARERFGSIPRAEPSPLPRTVEPPQRGERRVSLRQPRGEGSFEIAYRAPAVSHPDYAAFLLLQELLGGTGGVSFLQATFGTEVGAEGRLVGTADEVLTWFPPSALPYVLTLSGNRGDRSAAEVERAIEGRLRRLREEQVADAELDAARRRLLDELTFDLETTEDAAHQLAFFEGLEALEVLLGLPSLVERVTPDEIRRVASAYFQPWQRTIGWVVTPAAAPLGEPPQSDSPDVDAPREATSRLRAADSGPVEPPTVTKAGPPTTAVEVHAVQAHAKEVENDAGERLGEPLAFRLTRGLPVLFQRSPLSPTGYLLVVLPETDCSLDGRAVSDDPVWRHTAVGFRFVAGDAEHALREARDLMDACSAQAPVTQSAPEPSSAELLDTSDPDGALDRAFAELLGIESTASPGARPLMLALAGDLDPIETRRLTERFFGDLEPALGPAAPAPRRVATEKRVQLAELPQASLGYAVPAPSPAEPAGDAWRMLLYVLSHDYEGRLGVEAISRRGLAYYIGTEYHCDGRSAWIELSTGVDPAKLAPLRDLLNQTLAELRTRPPSDVELAEARRHLVGRRRTAAQSNPELAARLARDAICLGGPLSEESFRQRLEAIGPEEILEILPAFLAGAIVVVE